MKNISKLFKSGIEKKIIKERSGYRYNAFPKIFAKLPTMFGYLWQALRDRRHSVDLRNGSNDPWKCSKNV